MIDLWNKRHRAQVFWKRFLPSRRYIHMLRDRSHHNYAFYEEEGHALWWLTTIGYALVRREHAGAPKSPPWRMTESHWLPRMYSQLWSIELSFRTTIQSVRED
jgi:hypothetical protein